MVDEIVLRLRRDAPALRIALLLVDPTRRRSGGALLGDRIRMNAIGGREVFVRSMATRRAHLSLSAAVGDALAVLRSAGFDLVLLETAGIGQSDSEIVDRVDCSLYVMTPDYGAPSQLEKIDMLDFADLIVLNKCDRQGAADALRDVRKQWRRNRSELSLPDEQVPVFPTVARAWNDPGTERLAQALEARLAGLGLAAHFSDRAGEGTPIRLHATAAVLPSGRQRYLAEIAESVRDYHARAERSAERAALADAHARILATSNAGPERPLAPLAAEPSNALAGIGRDERDRGVERDPPTPSRALAQGYAEAVEAIDPDLADAAPPLARDPGGVPGEPPPLCRARPHRRGREPERVALGHAHSEGRAPAHPGLGRAHAFLRPRESPGALPVHRGRLPVQAPGGGSGAHVRG